MNDSPKTLRVVNLPRREAKEVGLLLPLVGAQTGFDWRLTEHSDAHVAMVDLDEENAHQALAEAQAQSAAIITISGQAQGGGPHIERPLRTQKLVIALKDALLRLGDGPQSPEAIAVAYRLIRWPTTGTLRQDHRLTRVCGALNGGAKPLDAVTSRTGIDPNELVPLLELLTETGCIAATEMPAKVNGHAVDAQRPGLFAKLRARLGRA